MCLSKNVHAKKKKGISKLKTFFFFQSYTLTGLNTYTQYLVSLRAYNPAGDGPETIVVVMTDEGGKLISARARCFVFFLASPKTF